MFKVTVLYGHPKDVDAFEKYYAETHLPLAGKINGVARIEITKIVGTPDGSTPAFYRMAELYFTDEEQLKTSMGSLEGQATAADLANFATGGAQFMIGVTD
jgi:uncharacterized protein (TIGR02118 family)